MVATAIRRNRAVVPGGHAAPGERGRRAGQGARGRMRVRGRKDGTGAMPPACGDERPLGLSRRDRLAWPAAAALILVLSLTLWVLLGGALVALLG